MLSSSRLTEQRSRPRRWLGGAALVLAGTVAAALAVTLPGSTPANGTELTSAELYQAPVRASATSAMLDFFLPASGAEFAAGQEYLEYATVAGDSVTSKCLAAEGLAPVAVHPLSYSGNEEEFPDISYLAKNGFVTPPTISEPSATAGMSAGALSAYKRAESRCETKPDEALAAVSRQGSSLETQWWQVIAEIDEMPAVTNTLKTFSTCLAATGVHASTITDFFTYATSKARAAGASLETAERSAGQLYARCVAPVEVARDAARASARAAFMKAHSATVTSLESSWTSALSTLESAGNPWPSP